MRAQIVKNAYLTLIRREYIRMFRIWSQTFLPSVITQSLYFLVFGGFIGSRVGNIEGVPYMAFIVPGLVMMSVIQNSYQNVISSFFGAKFMRSIDEVLVAPLPDWVMLAGYSTGGVIRGIITGVLVYGVAAFFTAPTVAHPWAVAVFLLLTSVLFSLAGFLNGIFAKKFDDISIFTTFILVPLTYLGGVFYSINQLPPFWRALSKFNPILYMVDGFRYGFYGVADVSVGWSVAAISAVIVALVWINLYFLKRGTGMKN